MVLRSGLFLATRVPTLIARKRDGELAEAEIESLASGFVSGEVRGLVDAGMVGQASLGLGADRAESRILRAVNLS